MYFLIDFGVLGQVILIVGNYTDDAVGNLGGWGGEVQYLFTRMGGNTRVMSEYN